MGQHLEITLAIFSCLFIIIWCLWTALRDHFGHFFLLSLLKYGVYGVALREITFAIFFLLSPSSCTCLHKERFHLAPTRKHLLWGTLFERLLRPEGKQISMRAG
jgi:hypothetical protein